VVEKSPKFSTVLDVLYQFVDENVFAVPNNNLVISTRVKADLEKSNYATFTDILTAIWRTESFRLLVLWYEVKFALYF